ncbi:MAG: sterile alpha motif-like domain-containing protein [Lachnospiraceae bacterium]|nr:sterile alpha motif-like domain-containing protein [Lachnospiraceae bacterium]
MTFFNFMMENYKGKAGAMGELAADMFDDRCAFPRNGKGKYKGWHKLISEYLDRHGAGGEQMEAFDEAWKEYVQCEKAKSKKRSHRQSKPGKGCASNGSVPRTAGLTVSFYSRQDGSASSR